EERGLGPDLERDHLRLPDGMALHLGPRDIPQRSLERLRGVTPLYVRVLDELADVSLATEIQQGEREDLPERYAFAQLQPRLVRGRVRRVVRAPGRALEAMRLAGGGGAVQDPVGRHGEGRFG